MFLTTEVGESISVVNVSDAPDAIVAVCGLFRMTVNESTAL